MAILDAAIVLLFVAASLGILFCVISSRKYTLSRRPEKKPPLKSIMAVVVVMVFCHAILCECLYWVARGYLRNFTKCANGQHLVVKVNGSVVAEPQPFLLDLAEVRPYKWGQHSYRDQRIHVEILSQKETLSLELLQHSRNKNEYLVFWPKYLMTTDNTIGKIRTTVVDDY